MASKIKKDDKVKILSGKYKGKEEKVLKVFPEKGKLLIENVNVVKKHQKPTQEHKGGIIEKTLPVDSSNVMLVCPSCKKPSRVNFNKNKEGKLVRVCKKCSQEIGK